MEKKIEIEIENRPFDPSQLLFVAGQSKNDDLGSGVVPLPRLPARMTTDAEQAAPHSSSALLRRNIEAGTVQTARSSKVHTGAGTHTERQIRDRPLAVPYLCELQAYLSYCLYHVHYRPFRSGREHGQSETAPSTVVWRCVTMHPLNHPHPAFCGYGTARMYTAVPNNEPASPMLVKDFQQKQRWKVWC